MNDMRRCIGIIAICILTISPVHVNAALSFTRVTSAAAWDVRSELTLTQLRSPVPYNTSSNGVLTGSTNDYLVYAGRGIGSYLDDDVWHSSNGRDWQLVSNSTISSSRPYSMSPGSTQCASSITNKMIMLSGHGPGDYYEISVDGGSTWRRINSQGFAARAYSACYFDENDAVYVLGGWLYADPDDRVMNDIWKKADVLSDSPFELLTTSASWRGRDGHAVTSYMSTTLNRHLVYLIGGRQQSHGWSSGDVTGSNDIWISSDHGVSFLQLTSNAPFAARSLGRLSASSNGVLVLTGGESNQFDPTNVIYADVWMSLDGGLTWGQCDSSSTLPYIGRRLHGALIDQDYYLWIAGGESSATKFNDIWRSTIRMNEADNLARECSLANVPCGVGLRCWPQTGTVCPACVISSSSSSSSSASLPTALSSSSVISSSALQSSGVSSSASSPTALSSSSVISSSALQSSGVSSSTSSSLSSSIAELASSSSSTATAGAVELEDPSSGSSSLSGGVIAAIVIACLIGLLLCWLLLVWAHTHRRQRMSSPRSISSQRSQSISGLQIAAMPPHVAFSQSELDTPEIYPHASSSGFDSSAASTWPASTSSMREVEISEV